jgi:hypothetical protein
MYKERRNRQSSPRFFSPSLIESPELKNGTFFKISAL